MCTHLNSCARNYHLSTRNCWRRRRWRGVSQSRVRVLYDNRNTASVAPQLASLVNPLSSPLLSSITRCTRLACVCAQRVRHERRTSVRAAHVFGRELRVGDAARALRLAARAGGPLRPVRTLTLLYSTSLL